MPDAYLDQALADFSGYRAIDEVYDGPFCILSVVDNRRYDRLASASWTTTRPSRTSAISSTGSRASWTSAG
jgi:hypothetical protein